MDLTTVVQRAVTFLLGERDAQGWWWDFDTLAGESDEWVTAYTGLALARSGTTAHHDAWRLLRSRWRWNGGWGYSRRVPADADSTAWALRLGHTVGAGATRRYRRALALLERHVGAAGGVATYRRAGSIRRFTALDRRVRFDGWCAPHVCVTAMAASVVGLTSQPAIRAFLVSHQDSDGSWPGYWWCDREVATGLAAEALAKGTPAERARAAAAATWALRESTATEPSDSAFRLAWRLRLFNLVPEPRTGAAARHRTVEELASLQRSDGSFPPSSRLRIPPPDVVNPDDWRGWRLGGRGGGSIIVDQRAIFTTATVVAALATVTGAG